MINKYILAAIAVASASGQALAGGLLTNTNQSVSFLRNPCQDATTDVQGVYNNPAGVAFLDEGLHLSFTIQSAYQTRAVESSNPMLGLGIYNRDLPTDENGNPIKYYKGKASAPIIPSLQAAYNKGKWSFQFGFAVTGGGGKCEFEDGLGSFESIVGRIATQLNALGSVSSSLGVTGYGIDGYLKGRQYFYGFTFGAAYKLNKNFSVYGGVRLLYGSASYTCNMLNVKVETTDGVIPFSTYVDNANTILTSTADALSSGIAQLQAGIAQYEAAGMDASTLTSQLEYYQTQAATVEAAQAQMSMLGAYKNGISLMCDQTGWGVAPIIGADYNIGRWNFGAKYEFKTRMRLKNKSTLQNTLLSTYVGPNDEPDLEEYLDGNKVASDSPALLTLGARCSVMDNVRVMAGWHHYFDVDTKQYTKDDLGDTNEITFGAEWDVNKTFTVSAGGQRTAYDLKDPAMIDQRFNLSSWSWGAGVKAHVSEKVEVEAAYFQTHYDEYNQDVEGYKNLFTRKNRVFGVGVNVNI